MKQKETILKIIAENQPIGIQKLDRLYHSIYDFSSRLVLLIEELRKDGFIEMNELKLTEKGIGYLRQ